MEYLKYNNNLIYYVILLLIYFNLNKSQISNEEYSDFCPGGCQIRFARLRCLQKYPRSDYVYYNDTADTHCFLQCFLYRTGLMNLKTRGLNSKKFLDIWENIEEAFEEDSCIEKFDFDEPLSGKCCDYYWKLMEFRIHCLELFEYTFTTNSSWKSTKSEESKVIKSIGHSATEFCDAIDGENIVATETSQDQDMSFFSQYKSKLQCIFQNFHYFDAYGRVDESEIVLSYQEAEEDSPRSRETIKICCHRANSIFQSEFYGDMALELQNCLKKQSPVFLKVYKQRDEISRQY